MAVRLYANLHCNTYTSLGFDLTMLFNISSARKFEACQPCYPQFQNKKHPVDPDKRDRNVFLGLAEENQQSIYSTG